MSLRKSPFVAALLIHLLAACADDGTGPDAGSLAISADSLRFTVIAGAEKADTQAVGITASGGMARWSATATHDWIELHPGTGQGPVQLRIVVNANALSPGTYVDTVRILAGADTAKVKHLVVRIAAIGLIVEPSEISFQTPRGESSTVRIKVTATCCAQVNWRAETFTPWLAVSPGARGTPGEFVVLLKRTWLVGDHVGAVVIRPVGTNAGIQMPVYLNREAPAARGLAFALESAIYVADADGTNIRRITPDGVREGAPVWSPDGETLLFGRTMGEPPEGPSELFSAAPDGSSPRQLTYTPYRFGANTQHEWSPDGSLIAFRRYEYGAELGIYVMKSDGTALRRVWQGNAGDPTWSPDGSRIAFTCTSYRICTIDPNGLDGDTIFDSPIHLLHLAWSPDGRTILASGGYDDANNFEIVSYDVAAGTLTRLTSSAGLDHSPTWSPDARTIMFVSYRGLPVGSQPCLYLMSATGENARLLSGSCVQGVSPSFRP